MNNILEVQGSIVALITPFDESGEVDFLALEKLVNWQIKSGTNALVPCGTTGEASTLSEIEYQEVIKCVVEVTNRRIPVIAGAGSNSTKKTVENSKIAKDCGADGLLIVTPFYNKPTVTGLIEHFKLVDEKINLPIIVYNVPGRTAQNIMPETILELAKLKNVFGVKEASGNIQQAIEIIAKRPANFKVYSGDDALTLATIACGGDGIISVAANQIPEEMTKLCGFALKGDLTEARKINYQYLDLMNLNFIEANPIPVKYIMSKMGMCREKCRLPLTTVSQSSQERLDSLFKELKL